MAKPNEPNKPNFALFTPLHLTLNISVNNKGMTFDRDQIQKL